MSEQTNKSTNNERSGGGGNKKYEKRDSGGGGNRNEQRNKRVQIPRFMFKKKKCKLCESNMKDVDYKNIDLLSRFYTDRGKILPRRVTGACAKHQRKIKVALKRARYMALLPFAKIETIKK